MKQLKADEFRCEKCHSVFTKGQSDETAQAEYKKDYPKQAAAKVEQILVCDDCYRVLIDWKSAQQTEQEFKG